MQFCFRARLGDEEKSKKVHPDNADTLPMTEELEGEEEDETFEGEEEDEDFEEDLCQEDEEANHETPGEHMFQEAPDSQIPFGHPLEDALGKEDGQEIQHDSAQQMEEAEIHQDVHEAAGASQLVTEEDDQYLMMESVQHLPNPDNVMLEREAMRVLSREAEAASEANREEVQESAIFMGSDDEDKAAFKDLILSSVVCGIVPRKITCTANILYIHIIPT